MNSNRSPFQIVSAILGAIVIVILYVLNSRNIITRENLYVFSDIILSMLFLFEGISLIKQKKEIEAVLCFLFIALSIFVFIPTTLGWY